MLPAAQSQPPRQPPPASLTHDKLSDFLPADVAARLVQQCHGYPSLDTLPGTRREDTVRWSGGHMGRGRDRRRAGPGSAPHLVEQEGPHARHPAAVVHHRRNVTRRERCVRQGPAPQTHAAPARGAEGPRQGKQPRLLAEVRRSGPEPRVPPCTTWSPADPGRRWDSLAVGLQLTDLEVDQHVVLAVTGPRAGPREGAELGGRHWGRTGEREAATDGRPDLPRPGGALRKEARGGERVQGSVGTSLPRGGLRRAPSTWLGQRHDPREMAA